MKIDKNILKSIKNILNKNKLLTLSTFYKNQPYSNTAYYTLDRKFNLYIWSETKTTHGKNILRNNKVSVNIFDSRQKWGSLLQGLQATGTITLVGNNKELIKAGILYIKRFPKSLRFVKNPKGFHNKIFESRLYKIKLNKIKTFDEKIFGKGEFREIFLT